MVEPSLPPPWTELPDEITGNILHRLGAVQILQTAQRVCKTWREVCEDPIMWRVIDMRNECDTDVMPYDLEEMCRIAVDRSQGRLVYLNLEYFATDQLLDYIGRSCTNLKRLRISRCKELSDAGLNQVIHLFPNLEELHIYNSSISCNVFEAVGRYCPLLRSLSFAFNILSIFDDDDDALSIGRYMPMLRRIKLWENCLTNRGLIAILDGCRHLESLDLRGCRYVRRRGVIWIRCLSEIRCLRHSKESTFDSDSDMEMDMDMDNS